MVLYSAVAAQGAEFKVESSVTVGEEYTDNIFLVNKDKEEEYITRITPSIYLERETPLWRWEFDYTLDYVDYTKGSVEDEIINDARVSGLINVVRDFFFVDISNHFSRVSFDLTRDFTKESLFLNQSDRNIFNVNPYIVLKPHRLVEVTTGYAYTNIWYEKDPGVDREDHAAYVEAALELSPKVKSTAGYRYTVEDTDTDGFKKNDIYLGLRYEYRENSEIYFKLGNTWLDFDGGRSFSEIFWIAGVSLASEGLNGSLETSRSYEEDPRGDVVKIDGYVLSLQKPFKRSSVGLSFWLREYSDGQTDLLETRAYGASGNISRELTSRMNVAIDFWVEELDRKLQEFDITRYLTGLRVNYLIVEDLTASVEYRFTKSDSEAVLDDYENNRVIIRLRKDL